MSNLARIWTDKQITKNIKKSLIEAVVWDVMLHIPWTVRRTNLSIRNEFGISDRLSIVSQACACSAMHVTRGDQDNLEKLIVQGRIESKRSRGRSPSRWLNQVRDIAGQSLLTSAKLRTDKDGKSRFSNVHSHNVVIL